MNGTIAVDSALGKGTKFKIVLRDVKLIKQDYLPDADKINLKKTANALLPKLVVLSSNTAHINLLEALAGELNLSLAERRPMDIQLKDINLQHGAIVFFDMDDYPKIDPLALKQIIQSVNNRSVLIGSRQQIAEQNLNPDFQFDLPAQKPLLERFLQSEINKAAAGLSGFNGSFSWPSPQNEKEKSALKELIQSWQKAQNSNFMVDAEDLAEKLVSCGKQFNWNRLEQFGLRLKNAAEGFDIEQTKLLLSQYKTNENTTDVSI
jgi:hypothetical protein